MQEPGTQMVAEPLLQTPLHDSHVSLGGRMVAFAGWSMPVTFAGITEEHIHTRTSCSVFDVSHMGRLRLTGSDCERFLDHLCARKLAGAEVGRSYYSHMCNEDGGILDDLIVSRFEDHWGIVCNGVNREKIIRWLDKHGPGHDIEVTDETMSTAMLAIQGPKAIEQAEQLTGLDLSTLKRYRFLVHEFMMTKVIIYRSGYTGEDGLEVVAPASLAKMLAPQLLGTRESPHPIIRPAGLGARDTLRIEAAMPLYGHELGEEVDPLTCGQGWCVDLSKDFIGAEPMRKLEKRGLPRQVAGLELSGKRIARQHSRILAGGRAIGEITSGTLSPTLGKSIAMGFVSSDYVAVGTELEVELGGKRLSARIVKLPFYKRPKAT